ncbi:MAG: hypothetical protein LC799_05695 [Actinobacteria bacterium]|nr:hypothetical protein [Actinomycetota bacterium]
MAGRRVDDNLPRWRSGVAIQGVGDAIYDSVTLSGGVDPGGFIVFDLYGPDGLPRQPRTVTVHGNGTYTSGTYIPNAAGTWQFVVRYTGDASNVGYGTTLGDPDHTVVVPKSSPTLNMVALPPDGSGTLQATAALAGGALAGGVVPTGTITFTLHPPSDPECLGTPTAQSSAAVFGNGTYASAPAPVTSPGVYRWVATYSGDGNNEPVRSPCDDPAGIAVVTVPQASSKDDCKLGGWEKLVDAEAGSFKNQGDCQKATKSQ